MSENRLYSNDSSAWDMRFGYFQTLEDALRFAFEARMSKDAPKWLDILDGIYSRVRPFFKAEEKTRFDSLFNSGKNELYAGFELDEDAEIGMSRSIDFLNTLERDLLEAMHKHSLLVPRTINPAHASMEAFS